METEVAIHPHNSIERQSDVFITESWFSATSSQAERGYPNTNPTPVQQQHTRDIASSNQLYFRL